MPKQQRDDVSLIHRCACFDVHSIDALASERRDSWVDLGYLPNWCFDQHKSFSPRNLSRLLDTCHRNGFVRIEEQSYPGSPWQCVPEKFDALAGQSAGALHHRHAGNVPARSREAGNEALPYRVTQQADNRDLVGRLLDHGGRRCSHGDQNVRLQLYQLGRKTGQAIVMALAKAVINDDVLSVGIPGLLDSISEALLGNPRRIPRRQPSDPWEPLWLLRAGTFREGEERCPSQAEHPDLAPPHAAASSARRGMDGASTLAVVRLSVASHLVDECTRRQGRPAPLRIRSVQEAASRSI